MPFLLKYFELSAVSVLIAPLCRCTEAHRYYADSSAKHTAYQKIYHIKAPFSVLIVLCEKKLCLITSFEEFFQLKNDIINMAEKTEG